MKNDIYHKLRKFLDTLPTGFPESPTGVEIKILKKLFTPEQAELTIQLSDAPEAIEDIAARLNMEERELKLKLEDMAQKGLIFRLRDGNKYRYQAFQFMIGIYEFQLKRLDREFCELFEEYLPYIGLSQYMVKTRQLRVVPVESAVYTTSSVETYNNIRMMVKGRTTIAVQECICSKEQTLLGNGCDKPKDACLGFGDFARYYLDNKMARQITSEEALAILGRAEKHGLVLQPSNTRNLEAICCCCTCCCPVLKIAKASKRPAAFIQPYYQAAIDSDLCLACGDCIDRCPMNAIKAGSTSMASEILDGRCIGCGLCVAYCQEEAISMAAKPNMEAPPKNFDDTFKKIKAEREAIA